MSDITIEGDVKAQQGICFNIFQLNQTYLGKDSRLNIGPKGFCEKYGGSTYWDTELIVFHLYGYKRPTSSLQLINLPLQSTC
jgi:maltose phosphorylase